MILLLRDGETALHRDDRAGAYLVRQPEGWYRLQVGQGGFPAVGVAHMRLREMRRFLRAALRALAVERQVR